MARIEVDYRDHFRELTDSLQSGGLVLVSCDADGKPNPITIGWAAMGPMWGRNIFVAMIRHSRYTFGLVEESGDFTVNLLPQSMSRALGICGTRSGRDLDKFEAAGLVARSSEHVKSPSIEGAVLTLECRVVEKTDMAPEWLDSGILSKSYADSDFHRFYFGQIVSTYLDRGEPEAD